MNNKVAFYARKENGVWVVPVRQATKLAKKDNIASGHNFQGVAMKAGQEAASEILYNGGPQLTGDAVKAVVGAANMTSLTNSVDELEEPSSSSSSSSSEKPKKKKRKTKKKKKSSSSSSRSSSKSSTPTDDEDPKKKPGAAGPSPTAAAAASQKDRSQSRGRSRVRGRPAKRVHGKQSVGGSSGVCSSPPAAAGASSVIAVSPSPSGSELNLKDPQVFCKEVKRFISVIDDALAQDMDPIFGCL